MAGTPQPRTDEGTRAGRSVYSNPHSQEFLSTSGPPSGPPEAPPLPQRFGHDIDTVRLRIPGPHSEETLEGPYSCNSDYTRGGEWLRSSARIRNLMLSASPGKLTIKGSVAKFANGTNAAPFDHGRLDDVFSEICAALPTIDHARLMDAEVTRLDFGANVPFPHRIPQLFDAVVCPSGRRLVRESPHSMRIETTRHVLTMYDKRKEQKKKKDGAVSEVYGSQPLVRVERRLMREVSKALDMPVTVATLLDPSFFARLGELLVEAVEEVPFETRAPWVPVSTPRELTKALARWGLADLGVNYVLAMIESDKDRGFLTKAHQAAALRKALRDLAGETREAAVVDLGREFVAALRAVVGLPAST